MSEQTPLTRGPQAAAHRTPSAAWPRREAEPLPQAPGAHVEIDVTDEAVRTDGGRVVIDLTPGDRGSAKAQLTSPLGLLVLCNVLNVLDAGLTILWIDMDVAVEGNPIVDTIGFPAKVVGVAIGSWIVYRVRPRVLWLPIVVLAAVNAYHLLGAVWFVLLPTLG
ncbi:hypothetical protein ER308_17405 [Egibacter rhizosphaerae]|uniref:DUF5658 domain-containing protein n=1 Tax=Egibacter rhizosphaerae TaxID=1670831 RepID=A0A411YJ44_9ACTN|nr:DUF5658 family protein [Egibacter rhizosphaerae]QBI21171.1 hypothetical protein ER308_17405 [Egibacter rhizosphaerae]